MHHNKKSIKNLGILAFAPISLFIVFLVYYFIILRRYIGEQRLEEHTEIVGTTGDNYTTLFILLAILFITAFIAFLVFVMNIWTRKNVASGQKIMWVIFMAVFSVVAFPIYWYMHIKNDIERNNPSPSLS